MCVYVCICCLFLKNVTSTLVSICYEQDSPVLFGYHTYLTFVVLRQGLMWAR